MFFNPRSIVPAVAALATLNRLASAAWDGTMRSSDVAGRPSNCPGLNPVIIGGVPSDDEFDKLCKAANENPCDDIMQQLSDNGPGSIIFTALASFDDCTKAGPSKGNLAAGTCRDKFVSCISMAGGVGAANQGVMCDVRNENDDPVATIAVNAQCLPGAGKKRSQEWTS